MVGGAVLRRRGFVCSWSGGKDSCLALWHGIRAGGRPVAVICMLSEDGCRTRSHRLPLWLIRRQAEALGIPLIVRSVTWAAYEDEFVSALREARALGAEVAVFGDLDLEEHRQWEITVCSRAGIHAWLPLFGRPRDALKADLIDARMRATVVAVTSSSLGRRFVGRELTPAFFADVGRLGADEFGEKGEYHTAVTDCALFSSALELTLGDVLSDDGRWFADLQPPVSPAGKPSQPDREEPHEI